MFTNIFHITTILEPILFISLLFDKISDNMGQVDMEKYVIRISEAFSVLSKKVERLENEVDSLSCKKGEDSLHGCKIYKMSNGEVLPHLKIKYKE